MFNKYRWVAETTEFLTDLANDGAEYDDLQTALNEHIDNAVIYYVDCFDIIKELGMTDWSDNEFGAITNISQLAYWALYDFSAGEIDIDAIVNSVDAE